jgi:hypothetical protein
MPTTEKPKPGLILQERDLIILRDLFESRVISLAQMATLHFEGRYEGAKKRIQILKANGLIAERPREPLKPSILFLPQKAFELLSEKGMLADYPNLSIASLTKRAQVSKQTIEHELACIDVKTSFARAIRTSNVLKLQEFSTWPLLSQFEAYVPMRRIKQTIKPDGFIRIHEHALDGGKFGYTFFMEIDRSTEKQDILAEKAACYLDYYKRGGFAVRNGHPPEAFQDFPFRVLIVCKTPERRNNAAERLLKLNPPIFKHAMLSTFDDVCANPLGPIWIQPVNYREATRCTPFDLDKQQSRFIYRRQVEREEFIEKAVRKSSLLSE